MTLQIQLPDGYTKTSMEDRYAQPATKLGPVLTPILSWQAQGDDGQIHTIRLVGCYYGIMAEIDGDTWTPADSGSLSNFLA